MKGGRMERRINSRRSVGWMGHVRAGLVGFAQVEVKDISQTGAQLHLPVHAARTLGEALSNDEKSTPIDLTFEAEVGIIPAPGHRCWQRVRDDGSVDLGMRFNEPLPDDLLN